VITIARKIFALAMAAPACLPAGRDSGYFGKPGAGAGFKACAV